ncbi:MAG: glycoside hydrolase family 127 protein, partial [Planctomycetales bacterium]|nr:glycoside hydrolase family 127 protein [Planctomycetales bacterium]
FFYVNPLAADGYRPFNHGHAGRAPWFGTACCPTNLARLTPQLPGMLFAQDDDGLMLCLYASSQTTVELAGQQVELKEETGYPFDGAVKLTLTPASAARFKLRMRIPTWTTDRLTPGELYRYANNPPTAVRLFVNDSTVDLRAVNGFAVIDREWSPGDVVRLELPMPVRVNTCRSEVHANHHRVALSRGPLVYCAESVDNSGHASSYFVDKTRVAEDAAIEPLLIENHNTMRIAVRANQLKADGSPEATTLRLIPYYAWNNRGVGSMAVWLPADEQTAKQGLVVVDDNAQRFASASASHTYSGDSAQAMIDGRLPSNSFDTSIPRWTSWPQRGQPQTLTFELAAPTDVRSIDVYWYDDHGGVQTPVRWELELPDGDSWRPFPLYNTDSYSTRPDQFNVVHPAEPVVTQRVRLKVWPRENAAAGILEFVVQPEGDQQP